ncbi:replicative DNA helicase [Streptomyces sp. NPDC088747]|uniref:replicative DNA helicase n=1 Tax=Streptomyces sp. NPDC088747 TaxID=3365886 RepID=UPI00381A7416
MALGKDVGEQLERPPHDLRAEKSLLSAMMASKDIIADVVEIVRGSDFYQPAHELIYQSILDLYARSEPADPVTVAAELAQRKKLDDVGGPSYIAALVQGASRRKDPSQFALRVQSTAILRRTMIAGRYVETLAADGSPENTDEVINAAQAEIFAATTRQHPTAPALPLGDIMEGALDEIEFLSSTSTDLMGLQTGFTDLDSLIGGLQPGHLIVVASRPAMGKSTLALDFLRSVSIKNDIPSVLFTLESGRNEVAMRIVAAEARVPLHHIRSGQLHEDDWTRMARRMPEVSAAPLYIQDADYGTLVDLRAQCRRLRSRNDIRLIVVDGLHMLTYGTRPFASRYEEISEIARCLKLLAKELDVPIVAVSQLNRGPEQRTDKRPMVSDLRDSGALEDNADLVILLHRDDAYEKESPRAGEADLIVAKHRNGPTATVTVAFQGHYSRFVDFAQA